MKITLLAEGSTKWQRLVRHWGMSFLIDTDVLFDTFGKPCYIVKQLKRLKSDIQKIQHIIISHDDWDHLTGLWKVLELNKDAAVYVCPRFKADIKEKIGLFGARLAEVDGVTNIRDNIYASGELAGKRRDSDIPEQYLAVKTEEGVVVITGCAHPGIIDIVEHAKRTFGSEVRLLMGGFHLKDNSYDLNKAIVAKVKELGVRRVMPLHCTGAIARKIFREKYGDDCIILREGQIITIVS
ncbi:MAG: MBL fold metallo-hydrolase [Candidatus Omnitrophica bacterium]|nr:MBL fold metallo-hydrolase [Candidatus Omnitrophota bacterium]MCM8791502.1 MBL fold metallo-hydrolase [Candidatus Omnitrophota bacterium]